MLATCLGVELAELRRLIPFGLREFPIRMTDDPAGLPADDLGLWFAVGDPAFAIVAVGTHSVAVLQPGNRRRTARNHVTYDIEAADGFVVFPRDDPDLMRHLPAVLRSREKLFRRRNCQGLAK